jgi:hypothetical protein
MLGFEILKMLLVVAGLLPKMLPLSPLTSNDVTDVATFPTSYIFVPWRLGGGNPF